MPMETDDPMQAVPLTLISPRHAEPDGKIIICETSRCRPEADERFTELTLHVDTREYGIPEHVHTAWIQDDWRLTPCDCLATDRGTLILDGDWCGKLADIPYGAPSIYAHWFPGPRTNLMRIPEGIEARLPVDWGMTTEPKPALPFDLMFVSPKRSAQDGRITVCEPEAFEPDDGDRYVGFTLYIDPDKYGVPEQTAGVTCDEDRTPDFHDCLVTDKGLLILDGDWCGRLADIPYGQDRITAYWSAGAEPRLMHVPRGVRTTLPVSWEETNCRDDLAAAKRQRTAEQATSKENHERTAS